MNERISARLGVCFAASSCIMLPLWIVAFMHLANYGEEMLQKEVYSFGYVNQIPRDWSRSPMSDIVVTNDYTCPESHPDLVFSRPWYGNNGGCECLDVTVADAGHDLNKNAGRVIQGKFCSRNMTNAGCNDVLWNIPVHMGQLNGKRFCGKPLKFNFMTL